MRSFTTFTAGALVGGALLVSGNVAAAQGTTPPDPATEEAAPATASTSTITLPLLGAPLVIDVSTDVSGGLVDVALNPADDYTATKIKANSVSFVGDAEGTRVRVSSRWGGERVTANAASLAEISGPGSWSGDVFGTGGTTTVAFTIGSTAEGGPDITGVTVDSPAEATVGDTIHDERSWGDKQHHLASATVEFAQNGQRRSLRITATVTEREDGTSSTVVVGLSRVHGRALVEGDPVGTHTWSGALCDGTPASVTYTVDVEGAITDVVATPEAEVRTKDRRAWAAFSPREGVWISSGESRWGDGDSDELTVGAAEWFRCDRTDPTVNTEIDPDATVDGERHGDWREHDGSDWRERDDWDWGERGDRDDDRTWGDDADRRWNDAATDGDWSDQRETDRNDGGWEAPDGDRSGDDDQSGDRGDDGRAAARGGS